jgi:hypothetical protein
VVLSDVRALVRFGYSTGYEYRTMELRRPIWSILGTMGYDGAGKEGFMVHHMGTWQLERDWTRSAAANGVPP